MKKKLKPIPEFKTEKEEAEFWDTHDTTEYEFEEEGILEVAAHITSPQGLSPRCPKDKKILLTRYVDVEIAGGRLILRHVRELYCREGHYATYPPEVEQDIRVHEAVSQALHEPEPQPSRSKKAVSRSTTGRTTLEKTRA
jgi:hypothetical protein